MSEAVDDSEVSKASSVVSGGECCKKSTSAATTAYLQAVPEENNMTSFHIPESNASDITESSSHYHRKGKPVQLSKLSCMYLTAAGLVSDWPSNQLTKTEALSGSQHVVLWLTRTSMSDIPSVPSLKNLVTSSVFGSGSRSGSLKHGSAAHYPKSSQNAIQRNFSTKSFLKFSSKEEEDPDQAPAIRKCETVIALSGMSSSSSTTSSRVKKSSSPMSVFNKLSAGGSKINLVPTGVVSNDQNVATSTVAGAPSTTCESPYPVSLRVTSFGQ